MLEGIVADLLTKYLGDYVQGLDQENLRLNVLSGQVFFTFSSHFFPLFSTFSLVFVF